MSVVDHEEYTEFGPWILDVPDATRVPRLFQSYGIDFEAAEIVMKIPRDIARRDANPSMDLYDTLLILGASELTLLERNDGAFSSRSVSVGSVLSMTKSIDLLEGRFHIVVDDGEPVRVRFNGSSQDAIDRLMRAIRRLSASGHGKASSVVAQSLPLKKSDDLGHLNDADFGLVSKWGSVLTIEPGLEFFEAHPSRIVEPLTGALSKLLHRFRPMVLSGAIVGVSPDEIHIIHRRDWLYRSTKEDVSSAHTVILRRAGVDFSSAAHPFYAGVHTVGVESGAARFAFEVATSAVARNV